MGKHKKSKSKKNKNSLMKLAAIELSMTTIVIIVISVIILIFGIIFARNVMCGAIQMNEKVNQGVINQITTLFAADKYGVNCEGEGGQDVKIGTGGRRKIICIIKTQEQAHYKLDVKAEIKRDGGGTSPVNKNWIQDSSWEGDVSPGGDGTEATIMLLNLPADAPKTTLKLTINENKNRGESQKTHTAYLYVEPAGFFRTTMC